MKYRYGWDGSRQRRLAFADRPVVARVRCARCPRDEAVLGEVIAADELIFRDRSALPAPKRGRRAVDGTRHEPRLDDWQYLASLTAEIRLRCAVHGHATVSRAALTDAARAGTDIEVHQPG